MTKKLLPLLLAALLSASVPASAFAAVTPTDDKPALAGMSEDAKALAEAAELIRTEAGEHRLILLGEMHGTREAPKLLAALATAYAHDGPVAVGMELPSSLQPAIDEFMASDGSKEARAKLLAAPAWHVARAHSDGRRNLEVISLLSYLRLLKAQVRDVSFRAFDPPSDGTPDSQARDKAMAERIREAYSKFPDGRMLTLSGNVHAMLLRPSFLAQQLQQPMGSYLRDLKPFSVDVAARGGEYWACREVCGPVALPAVHRQSGEVDLFDHGYNLRVVLPRFTVARLIPE